MLERETTLGRLYCACSRSRLHGMCSHVSTTWLQLASMPPDWVLPVPVGAQIYPKFALRMQHGNNALLVFWFVKCGDNDFFYI